MSTRYTIIIHPMMDDDEKYWYAYYPAFGHSACSATGSTVEETLELLEKVKLEVIEYYKETGKEIPEAKCLSFFHEYKGEF